MKRDTARVQRLFLTLARTLGACILGMNSLSGPSLTAVDCQRWNDYSHFNDDTLTDVEQCLSAGADVFARDNDGNLPIDLTRKRTKVYWLLNDARFK